MIQKVLNHIFRLDKRKIQIAFSDINTLYFIINKNDGKIGEWYLKNTNSKQHISLLVNFSHLSNDELALLHQGILNIQLFNIYKYLEENGAFTKSEFSKLRKALYSFSPVDILTIKLCQLLKKSLLLVTLKQQGKYDKNTNGQIYKSITWTLKNTIINSEKI